MFALTSFEFINATKRVAVENFTYHFQSPFEIYFQFKDKSSTIKTIIRLNNLEVAHLFQMKIQNIKLNVYEYKFSKHL